MSVAEVTTGGNTLKVSIVTIIRIPLGVIAFVYGVIAVTRSALGDASLGASATELARIEAIWHVLFWTFGPPLWFAVETWALKGAGNSLMELERGQKQMSAIWAATLAAILFLIKP